MRAEKLTNDLFGSSSKEDIISSKRCWTSGTTRRASFTRFAPMTGTSTFFDNKHRHPMGCGIWFRFARNERYADAWETTGAGQSTSVGHSALGSERR